jgi:hypothetical protein
MQKEVNSLRRASSASIGKLHKFAVPPPENGGGGGGAGDMRHDGHEDATATWELQVMLRAEKENNKFLADSLGELQVCSPVPRHMSDTCHTSSQYRALLASRRYMW